MVSVNNLHEIYDKLNDEESKDIFELRFAYAMHEADAFDFERFTRGKRCFFGEFDVWYNEEPKDLAIFGGGRVGKYTASILKDNGYPVKVIADSLPRVDTYLNIPLISFNELRNERNKYRVIIGSDTYRVEMLEQLLRNDFSLKDIYFPRWNFIRGWTENQYFDFFEPGEKEVFIDGGAYNGYTTLEFAKWAGTAIQKSYLFEANPQNRQMILNNLNGTKVDYMIISKGLYSRDTTLRFGADDGSGASIVSDGGIEIEVTSIDNSIPKTEDVTFIKMDIEGAEMEAIEGARNTIRRCRPKLAISVYHKYNDFINIPLKITQICQDYKFALRHYCTMAEETVLYGWI